MSMLSVPTWTKGDGDGTMGRLGDPPMKAASMDWRTTEDVVTSPSRDNEADSPILIGVRNEIPVDKLPLTLAQDFLATERQRAQIANGALDELLAVSGNHLDWNCFDQFRDEIKRRTGVNDTAVSLVLLMRFRSSNVRTW